MIKIHHKHEQNSQRLILKREKHFRQHSCLSQALDATLAHVSEGGLLLCPWGPFSHPRPSVAPYQATAALVAARHTLVSSGSHVGFQALGVG